MKINISILGALALAVGASAKCVHTRIPRPSTTSSTSSTSSTTATSSISSTTDTTDTTDTSNNSTSNVLYKGKGFGTYYYDVEQLQACGADFTTQNVGNVMCGWDSVKTLNDIDSNNLVAMNSLLLKTAEGRAKYCGKRIIVTVDGVKSDIPFFVGDGCERCARGDETQWQSGGAAGLDFSFSTLNKLSPLACQDGHVAVEYEIVDETLYHFDTN
ncbi:hypothetical protein MY5147_004002 [Beauveria neobassiana]